jgi:multiple sugar transport system substrate-binding protein
MASRKVRFAFWPARPDIVLDNIRLFESHSGISVDAIEIPDADYTAALETRLRSGAVDIFYAQRGEAARWNAQGLIEHLERDRSVTDLVARMVPAIRESSVDLDGHLLGLTYYNAGPFALFRNEPMLAQAGFGGSQDPAGYPPCWNDVTRQARTIKREALSDFPILPRWHRTQTGLVWSVIAQAWSMGERFIDQDGRGTFGIGTPLADLLSLWQEWWTDELVPLEAIAWSGDTESIEAWRSGRHAWTFTIDYLPSVFTAPPVEVPITHASPRLPGSSASAAIPGHALLCLSRRSRAVADREAALQLMQFLGGDGLGLDFFVPRRWMLEMNLPQPFAHLTDARTVATMGQHFHPSLSDCATRWILDTRARSEVPLLVRLPWFCDWSDIADEIIGTGMLAHGTSVRDTISDLRLAWERLRVAQLATIQGEHR